MSTASTAHTIAPSAADPSSRLRDPRICAVIVTYFPRTPLTEPLAILAPQVHELLIVDNGSPLESLRSLTQSAESFGATLLPLGFNRGIGHALNVGLHFAHARGCHWLATFDQDSLADSTMLATLLHAARSHPHPERIALISPVHVDRKHGIPLGTKPGNQEGPLWRELQTAMTSGNLVDVPLVLAHGGFEADFFMDYVDHELCLRLRAASYHILEARSARLLHALGQMSAHRLGPHTLHVTHHSVTRRYYMSRNRFVLWGRYARSESHWVRRDMRGFLTELLGILLYERHRTRKLLMILRGAWDALRGVRGPLPG